MNLKSIITPKTSTIVLITALLLINSNIAFAQRPTWGQREWSAFSQLIPVKTDKKIKFKVQVDIKVIGGNEKNKAGLWVRVDNLPGAEYGFFKSNDSIISSDWKTYTIEGHIDQNAEKIYVGGLCNYNAKFYFDNFRFYTQNEKGEFEKFNLKNPGFEKTVINKDIIPDWIRGISNERKIRIEGFTYQSTKDANEGNYALLIESKNVKKDSSNFIRQIDGYNPQIGTLVSMLNNLSTRVEREVKMLNQREIDHLFDEKANSIGALIMHLAAAEAYYQVVSFEDRDFNEEEQKKWGIALDLGDKARETIKGHDVEYYLDIYKEVRKKTLEELQKRNDKWLNEGGSSRNNHFNWFHVMEHQSSHLGQIRFLKKRIPEDEKIKLPDEKVD